MKTDTIKKEPVDPTRGIFKKGETILKDKNLIKEKENPNEKTEDDQHTKSECQLEKHTET